MISFSVDQVRCSFGFRDGLSQPLLKGINSDEALKADPYMQTDLNVIIVSSKPPGVQDGVEAFPKRRPHWMVNGSFLAFRKLEQDVPRWIELVNRFEEVGCKSPAHLGAKLMGRWPSGKAPKPPKPRRPFLGDSQLTRHFCNRSPRCQIPRRRHPSWYPFQQ